MAEIFMLGDSETYGSNVLVTHVNAENTVQNSRDKDIETYTSFDSAWGRINFNFREEKSIRHFFMRCDNVDSYDLRVSSNGTNYSNVVAGIDDNNNNIEIDNIEVDRDGLVYYFGFNSQIYQYWQLYFDRRDNTRPARIYEVRLMNFALALESLEEQPSIYTRSVIDFNDTSYRLANGRLVTYEGTTESGKNRINFEWDYLQNLGLIKRLKNLWSGPPQKPVLDVIPDTHNYPYDILRCRWNNDFDFNYSGENRDEGFNISIEFMEL